MTDHRDDDPYLWDRSGPADPEIARLEALLAPLAHHGRAPALPPARARVAARFSAVRWPYLPAAAAVLLVAVAGWFVYGANWRGWAIQSVAGAPAVDGVPIDMGLSAPRLRVGAWLTTDATSRARIAVGRIGRVDVDPNTRVQLVEAKGREHRMSLERGTIHAQISAPPRFFFVNTPSAVAIDLGCAYTLQVDDTGAGLLRVTSGWVAFESDGREAFIPAGAMCATRRGVGPGTPRYEDAPSGYGEAITTLDFGRADDPERAGALALVLSQARPRDAMTLWHLLARGTPDERAQVYDRMAVLVPPPRGVTRDAVLRGDRGALAQWWEALGIETWKVKKF